MTKPNIHRTTVNIWNDVWKQIEDLRAARRPIPTRSKIVDELLRKALRK